MQSRARGAVFGAGTGRGGGGRGGGWRGGGTGRGGRGGGTGRGGGPSFAPLVTRETWGGIGHRWFVCRRRCLHCPGRANHNGQRCPYGVATDRYPIDETRAVTPLDRLRRIDRHTDRPRRRPRTDEYWRNRVATLERRVADAESALAAAPAGGTNATAGTAGRSCLTTGGNAVIVSQQPLPQALQAAAKQPTYQPLTTEHLPGYVPTKMAQGLATKQRHNWKRCERTRKNEFAYAMGTQPRQKELEEKGSGEGAGVGDGEDGGCGMEGVEAVAEGETSDEEFEDAAEDFA